MRLAVGHAKLDKSATNSGWVMRRLRGVFSVVLVMAAIQVGGVTTAQAAYPGANGLIAFVRVRDIWTVSPTTHVQTRLTFTGRNREPVWSPNGKRIAFIRQTTAEHLWVMNADGSNAHAITTQYVPDEFPTWSPDGNWIAFSRLVGFTRPAIFKIRSSYPYGAPIRLTTPLPGGGDSEPTWSPLGGDIIFTRSGATCDDNTCSQLDRVSSSGGTVSSVVTGDTPADPRSADYGPQARAIAFSGPDLAPGIWVAGSDGSNAHRLTMGLRDDLTPAWAPNRKELTFSRYCQLAGCTSTANVWTINADGSGARLLVKNGLDPNWQPVPQP